MPASVLIREVTLPCIHIPLQQDQPSSDYMKSTEGVPCRAF